MSDELTLFEVDQSTPATELRLSADRQRTLRQHAAVARGVHPLAQRPTRPDLGTCGDCAFRQVLNHRARSYAKCTFDPARLNHSANTDCRAWWPACPDHKKKDD